MLDACAFALAHVLDATLDALLLHLQLILDAMPDRNLSRLTAESVRATWEKKGNNCKSDTRQKFLASGCSERQKASQNMHPVQTCFLTSSYQTLQIPHKKGPPKKSPLELTRCLGQIWQRTLQVYCKTRILSQKLEQHFGEPQDPDVWQMDWSKNIQNHSTQKSIGVSFSSSFDGRNSIPHSWANPISEDNGDCLVVKQTRRPQEMVTLGPEAKRKTLRS